MNENENNNEHMRNEIIVNGMFADVCRNNMNWHAVEKVILHLLQPTDKIPFSDFAKELSSKIVNPSKYRDGIAGFAIEKDETIVNKPYDYYVRLFYTTAMNNMFEKVPQRTPYKNHVGLYYFDYNLTEYLECAYQLFLEILSTEVEFEFICKERNPLFDIAYDRTYDALAGLLRKYLTHSARLGGQIDGYAQAIIIAPSTVKCLFQEKRRHFYATAIEKDDLEFKLALLSSIKFLTPAHAELFTLKVKMWAELHNA